MVIFLGTIQYFYWADGYLWGFGFCCLAWLYCSGVGVWYGYRDFLDYFSWLWESGICISSLPGSCFLFCFICSYKTCSSRSYFFFLIRWPIGLVPNRFVSDFPILGDFLLVLPFFVSFISFLFSYFVLKVLVYIPL